MLQLLPPEIQVFLISMLPALELRFSIPYGMAALDMNRWTALGISLLGNGMITIFLLWALDPVTLFLRKHVPGMKSFTDWLFQRTRNKHNKRVGELGHLALFVFVAIPLPGSGSWSGALVSYLFGVKKTTALFWISLGLIVAGFLVTFGTAGIMKAVELIIGG